MELLIPLAVLAVGGVLALVIALVVKHKRRADAAWSDAAGRLGLSLRPPRFLKGRRLTGLHRGLDVRVHTYTVSSGNSSQTYTGYRVRYPALGLGLKLKRQGAFAGLARIFGRTDMEIGHPLFDDAVVVQAHSRLAVQEFLTPLRRKKILRALESYKGLKIADTELSWSAHGTETDATRIEERVRRLVDLARVLVDDERERTPLARGLLLQAEGRLDDALLELDRAVRESDDPDARVAAGEALLTSGRYAEAAVMLGGAEERLAGDAEVAGLAAEARRRAGVAPTLAGWVAGEGSRRRYVDSTPRAEPPVPFAAPAAEPPAAAGGSAESSAASAPLASAPRSASTSSAPPAGRAPAEAPVSVEAPAPGDGDGDGGDAGSAAPVDLDELCATLFATGRMSFEVARDFDERYAGRPVRWSGTLERLEHYYSDVAFGSGPGTRALLQVGELADDGYGGKTVNAIVQLPEAARTELRERVGERFELAGTLVRCDAFMRNLFVADGALE